MELKAGRVDESVCRPLRPVTWLTISKYIRYVNILHIIRSLDRLGGLGMWSYLMPTMEEEQFAKRLAFALYYILQFIMALFDALKPYPEGVVACLLL